MLFNKALVLRYFHSSSFSLEFFCSVEQKGMELQEKCMHAKPSKGSAGRCSQALLGALAGFNLEESLRPGDSQRNE